MHGLEVPEVFAAVDVDRHHRIAIEVGAGAITAPVVSGGAAKHGVEDLALLVEREVPAPVVDALPVLPSLVEPALRVIRIARLRHRSKVPELRARSRVERLGVSRRRTLCDLAVVGPDDDDVLVDERHPSPGNAHVDEAAVSKRRVELTARCRDRDETLPHGHQDAGRDRSIPGPVREATARGCATGTSSRWRRGSAPTSRTRSSGWTGSTCWGRACGLRRASSRRRRGRLSILRSISVRRSRTTAAARSSWTCGASSAPSSSPSGRWRRAIAPDQHAGVGVQRHNACRRRRVQHAADDNRRLLRADAFEGPRLRESRDVCRVDLRELRVLRAREIAGEARPVAIGERLDAALPGDEMNADGHQRDGQNDWEKRTSHARRLQHNPNRANVSERREVRVSRAGRRAATPPA